jgi:3-methyladenine DNA glycosylase AlkD
MSVQSDLQKLKNKERAKLLQGYFKTGKGEYGEGDVFIGLTVPQVRVIAKKYKELPLKDVEELLHNRIHEYRLTALFILCDQFKKTDEATKKTYFDFYLANTKWINNWDLIDLSARDIIGGYCINKKKERKILYTLARSESVWERRIAILATCAFFRKNDFTDTYAIAEILLHDKHDLMHKAVGWMLREAGKRDENSLVGFLKKHYKTMPRTMLRYAIEKFSPAIREKYLKGNI